MAKTCLYCGSSDTADDGCWACGKARGAADDVLVEFGLKDITRGQLDIYMRSQAWTRTETFRAGEHKLRSTVHRNVYDDQSCGLVERWDGSKWQHVEFIPLELLPESVAKVDCVLPESDPRVCVGLREGGEYLLLRALDFINL